VRAGALNHPAPETEAAELSFTKAAASWRRGLPAYDFVLLEVIIIATSAWPLALGSLMSSSTQQSTAAHYNTPRSSKAI
jgi:hypothetical protein